MFSDGFFGPRFELALDQRSDPIYPTNALLGGR